ncbi:MAG: DUF488 domain-containing protein [Methanobacteriaceae archaeon]
MINIKRAYQPASDEDGVRILVDRLWPRGVSKDRLKIDLWLKEIAPSNELRKWFAHDQGKWAEFKTRYQEELKEKGGYLDQIKEIIKKDGKVTLIYSAKDEDHNNAVVLRDYILNQKT